jgi:hypothetical protein
MESYYAGSIFPSRKSQPLALKQSVLPQSESMITAILNEKFQIRTKVWKIFKPRKIFTSRLVSSGLRKRLGRPSITLLNKILSLLPQPLSHPLLSWNEMSVNKWFGGK